MTTLVIQIDNEKALSLIRDLQDLRLIKIIEDRTTTRDAGEFAGKLSERVAEDLQTYIRKSREEWKTRDI